jgi:hypothetical protein
LAVYVQWDDEKNVLADEQCLPLSPATIKWLEEKIAIHKTRSSFELEHIARKTLEKRNPNMLAQANFDRYHK